MSEKVQIYNPALDRYVKLSVRTGRILATKKTPGPYADITIRARTSHRNDWREQLTAEQS